MHGIHRRVAPKAQFSKSRMKFEQKMMKKRRAKERQKARAKRDKDRLGKQAKKDGTSLQKKLKSAQLTGADTNAGVSDATSSKLQFKLSELQTVELSERNRKMIVQILRDEVSLSNPSEDETIITTKQRESTSFMKVNLVAPEKKKLDKKKPSPPAKPLTTFNRTPVEDLHWTCPSCTLHNGMADIRCTLCETPRPRAEDRSDVKSHADSTFLAKIEMLDDSDTGSDNEVSASLKEEIPEDFVPDRRIMRHLTRVLCFKRRHAIHALHATKNKSLSEALDWLCLNLSEDRLASAFGIGDENYGDDDMFGEKIVTLEKNSGELPPDIPKKTQRKIRTAKGSGKGVHLGFRNRKDLIAAWRLEERLMELCGFGFSRKIAKAALSKLPVATMARESVIELALLVLLPSAPPADDETATSAYEEWKSSTSDSAVVPLTDDEREELELARADEIMALECILGEDKVEEVNSNVCARHFVISLEIDFPSDYYELEEKFVERASKGKYKAKSSSLEKKETDGEGTNEKQSFLEIFIPLDSKYPESEVPRIFFRNTCMEPKLQVRVMEKLLGPIFSPLIDSSESPGRNF